MTLRRGNPLWLPHFWLLLLKYLKISGSVLIADGYGGWRFGTMSDYLKQLLGSQFDLEFIPIKITQKDTKALKTPQGLGGRYSKTKFKGSAKTIKVFFDALSKS